MLAVISSRYQYGPFLCFAEIVAVGAQQRQVAERDGDTEVIADQSTCVVVPRVRDRGVGVRHRLGDERHRAGKLGGDV